MVEPFDPQRVQRQLDQWLNQEVYIHLEVNPGAYWRNGRAVLRKAHVKGRGPYRIYLELDGSALIQVDDLTHMQVETTMVIGTGYDSNDRIARTVEVSPRPLSM